MTSPATGDLTSGATTGARIDVSNLSKHFGSFAAVENLSFSVTPGRITGFLGPNGAGKTTTLRMLLGLVRPTAGTALIDGHRYADIPNPTRVVGSALEATNFHPGRSGRNHLLVLADAAGIPAWRVDEMLELVGIPAAAQQRAGGYSMGMRQRLGLAAALLGNPKVVILDEPANGLDPEGIRWLRAFLRHLASEGKTVLISSHLLSEVEQTVDDVVIIANGVLVRSGPIEELRGSPAMAVRTRDVDALASALTARGMSVRPDSDGLLVQGSDAVAVGDAALAAGQPIYGLQSRRADLEELYFLLTEAPENQNRNRQHPVAGSGPGGHGIPSDSPALPAPVEGARS